MVAQEWLAKVAKGLAKNTTGTTQLQFGALEYSVSLAIETA